MKILQINKFHYLKGGSERYYFDLSHELERQGHKVIFFSMLDNRNEETKYKKYFIKNIDLYKFSLINIIKFFYNYEAVSNLKKLLKEEKPDIAHLHNIAHQLSPAIINVLKKYNIPIVQTLHDYKLICPNAQLYNQGKICEKCNGGKYYRCFTNKCMHNSRAKSFLVMLEAYLHQNVLKTYQKIDLFLAPSQFMKDTCVRFGVNEQKIKTIYNFIPEDFNKFNSTHQKEENKNPYLLYFGRISEEKGIDILIKALAMNKNKINLKIAGIGLDLENLKKQIKKHNLSKRVELLGHKSGNELKNLILNSKAILIPSLWPENMPFSLIEALSLGRPVIVSRVGGMPELIKEGFNGFTFQAGNIPDLASKIDLLSKMRFNLSEQNNLLLNIEKHSQKILRIYQNLLSK
jgi:glycosyltransferase involved in cell wall biosynthesis